MYALALTPKLLSPLLEAVTTTRTAVADMKTEIMVDVNGNGERIAKVVDTLYGSARPGREAKGLLDLSEETNTLAEAGNALLTEIRSAVQAQLKMSSQALSARIVAFRGCQPSCENGDSTGNDFVAVGRDFIPNIPDLYQCQCKTATSTQKTYKSKGGARASLWSGRARGLQVRGRGYGSGGARGQGRGGNSGRARPRSTGGC